MTEYSDVSPSTRLESSLARLRSELLKRNAVRNSLQLEIVAVPQGVAAPEVHPTSEILIVPEANSAKTVAQLRARSFSHVLTMLRHNLFSLRR
jgi:hypothetical protein